MGSTKRLGELHASTVKTLTGVAGSEANSNWRDESVVALLVGILIYAALLVVPTRANFAFPLLHKAIGGRCLLQDGVTNVILSHVAPETQDTLEAWFKSNQWDPRASRNVLNGRTLVSVLARPFTFTSGPQNSIIVLGCPEGKVVGLGPFAAHGGKLFFAWQHPWFHD